MTLGARCPAIITGFLVIVLTLGLAAPVLGFDEVPIPQGLEKRGLEDPTDPMKTANAFLHVPYRIDGTVDEQGRFVLFEEPDRVFKTPGLNCSGLALGITRFLLGSNISLATANKDRLGDSGPDSERGESWDYGWDLVLNLTEGRVRRIIMPGGEDPPIEGATAETLRGFDLQNGTAWEEVLDQIHPGRLYLASFSKPTRKIPVLHWHVALILADDTGGIWMYQTTRTNGRSYRINLKSPGGMGRFRKAYPHSRFGEKRLLVIETRLPVLNHNVGE